MTNQYHQPPPSPLFGLVMHNKSTCSNDQSVHVTDCAGTTRCGDLLVFSLSLCSYQGENIAKQFTVISCHLSATHHHLKEVIPLAEPTMSCLLTGGARPAKTNLRRSNDKLYDTVS